MSDLFIPDKIRVGFRKRDDTYTKKLAYVIYYDTKGKLRKETSWESWRDKGIAPVEFDNKPTDGFILNKGIQRFNWNHFGSGRSYIRVYDSRGIEFEITPENLLGILTETDCSRRGLTGEFVYAWSGTELVLLPCCSQEYKEAQKFTGWQAQKIAARDLKHGCSYTTKKGEEVIYMGRFEWFEWTQERNGRDYQTKITSAKKHVFAHAKKPEYVDQFFPKGDVSFLAVLNNPDAVVNYAELVEKWNANPHSCAIEEWVITPLKVDAKYVFESHQASYYPQLKHNRYVKVDGDNLHFYSLDASHRVHGKSIDDHNAYQLDRIGTLNRRTMIFRDSWQDEVNGIPRRLPKTKTRDEIMSDLASFSTVKAVLKSGKQITVTDMSDLNGTRY